jgi:superfamily II DNA or RNA helicase
MMSVIRWLFVAEELSSHERVPSEVTHFRVNFETLRLRPYQVEAQQAIIRAREQGNRAQLISMATGLGKSVLIATLPRLLALGENDVALVIAHRDELIQQLADKLYAQNPDRKLGIEKAESRASEDCAIVVATVQTLTGPRLTEFLRRFGGRISLFVIDEAHHAAAPTYKAILEKIVRRRPEALVLGFTATPNRGDGERLLDIFHEIVFSMDARRAIDEGYLVPVRSHAVATAPRLDQVATRAGDFVLGQLAKAVDNEERNRQIVDAYARYTPDRKALVFTASVEHARNLAEIFRTAGFKAAFASGETPQLERERIVREFRGTKLDVLVNCGLYLEGFDVPSIEVIMNARPTKSTTLYTQVTGRGMRPLDEFAYVLSELPSPEARREVIAQSSKPYVIAIDIVDRARRHQLITLPTLWGLPSQIDAQGRPISQVAAAYEELYRRSPRDAAHTLTAEKIESRLIELDEAAKPKQVPTWQPLAADHWRLERPPHFVARDRKGHFVPHFSKRFDELVTMAKSIAPHEDAHGFALRLLDVDRRSVTEERTRIDVMPGPEGYVAILSNGAVEREIVSAPSVVLAIHEVENKLTSGEPLTLAQPAKNGARRRRFRGRRKRKATPSPVARAM